MIVDYLTSLDDPNSSNEFGSLKTSYFYFRTPTNGYLT